MQKQSRNRERGRGCGAPSADGRGGPPGPDHWLSISLHPLDYPCQLQTARRLLAELHTGRQLLCVAREGGGQSFAPLLTLRDSTFLGDSLGTRFQGTCAWMVTWIPMQPSRPKEQLGKRLARAGAAPSRREIHLLAKARRRRRRAGAGDDAPHARRARLGHWRHSRQLPIWETARRARREDSTWHPAYRPRAVACGGAAPHCGWGAPPTRWALPAWTAWALQQDSSRTCHPDRHYDLLYKGRPKFWLFFPPFWT